MNSLFSGWGQNPQQYIPMEGGQFANGQGMIPTPEMQAMRTDPAMQPFTSQMAPEAQVLTAPEPRPMGDDQLVHTMEFAAPQHPNIRSHAQHEFMGGHRGQERTGGGFFSRMGGMGGLRGAPIRDGIQRFGGPPAGAPRQGGFQTQDMPQRRGRW